MDYTTLKTNPSNPRRINKDQFERLKKSIGSFTKMLEIRPIAYDEDGVIWGGNMRYEALKALNIEMKPEYFKELKGFTLEEKREFAIRDNIELGEWDDDILANEWGDLPLDDWGIDTKGWEKEVEVEEDDVPEVSDEEPISKLGEVYQLGRHRLMCGDATSKEDVEKLMNGQKADMVFTDPPYGMNLDTDYSKMPGTSTHYKKVIGDDKEFDMTKIFKNIKSPIWYVWGADYLYKTIPNFDDGVYIVWSKRMSDEENKVFGSAYELCWTYPKRKKEIWFVRGINQSSERLGVHPTQKPTELCVRALKQNENAKNIIDVFGGSGSTLIACEQLNRTCYMCELDNKYIDVIIKRWMKFTGKRAKRIIDAEGKPVEEDVVFADENFMQ